MSHSGTINHNPDTGTSSPATSSHANKSAALWHSYRAYSHSINGASIEALCSFIRTVPRCYQYCSCTARLSTRGNHCFWLHKSIQKHVFFLESLWMALSLLEHLSFGFEQCLSSLTSQNFSFSLIMSLRLFWQMYSIYTIMYSTSNSFSIHRRTYFLVKVTCYWI